LYNLIISIILNIISFIIKDKINILGVIYSLAVLLPGLAVAVRRLHDVGKSGWMLFISLIPLVGTIWLIVLMVRDSEPLENKYGPNLKITTVNQILFKIVSINNTKNRLFYCFIISSTVLPFL